LPVGQIVEPLSRVSIVVSFIYQCPLSLCDIVPHLALIITSLAENVATIAVGKTMSKRAVVVWTILKEKLTDAMGFIVLPLSPVYGFGWLNQKRRALISFHLTRISHIIFVKCFQLLAYVRADGRLHGSLEIFGWLRNAALRFTWAPRGSGNRLLIIVGLFRIIGIRLTASRLSHIRI
jgi:hypothetical protein